MCLFFYKKNITFIFYSVLQIFFLYHVPLPEVDHIEEREKLAFQQYTKELMDFAKSQPPYVCKGNCKAPSRAYIGAPWMEHGMKKALEGDSVSITCHIWTKFNIEAMKGRTIASQCKSHNF